MKIIAECGTNHGGSLESALALVDIAWRCGANVVKFQHVDPSHFKVGAVWRGWNLREWYLQCRFTPWQWRQVMAACDDRGIGFLCTPQTVGDLHDLLNLCVKEIKISSDNLTNHPLLEMAASSGLPVIISTGMATTEDLKNALYILDRNRITVMICTSLYPCPPEYVNLSRIHRLDGWRCEVGFSDHTSDTTAALVAYGMGARTFEKHLRAHHPMDCYMYDREFIQSNGPDGLIGESEYGMAQYVKTLLMAEKIMGSGEFVPAPGARDALELAK